MSTTQTIEAPASVRRYHVDNGSAITLQPFTSRPGEVAGSSIEAPEDNALVEDVWDSAEGWKVVIAGASIFFVYLGLVYSYGIVQLHLEAKQLANVPTLSFIGSVAVRLEVGYA